MVTSTHARVLTSAGRFLIWLLAASSVAFIALEAPSHIHGISDPSTPHTHHSVAALAQIQQGFTVSPAPQPLRSWQVCLGHVIPAYLGAIAPYPFTPQHERAPPFEALTPGTA